MIGIVDLYKEMNMTSHDCVNQIRKIYNIKRVGHSGTLDPQATGVLNIYLGNATKYIDYLKSETKSYHAGFQFGMDSDTLDIWGNLKHSNKPQLTAEEVNEALLSFFGDSLQVPPMYSAKKVNGKPLYKYARDGKVIERSARKIRISSIELLSYDSHRACGEFLVSCSKGTYIRSLIRDFAIKLDSIAVMNSLVRTENDFVRSDQTYTLDEIRRNPQELIRQIDKFSPFNKLTISSIVYQELFHGRTKEIPSEYLGEYVLLYKEGKFCGLAKWNENTYLKLRLERE